MKIKIKISIEDLNLLMNFVRGYLQVKGKLLSSLEEINLKAFIYSGMKKIMHATENSLPKNKAKKHAFEINVFAAMQYSLYMKRETLEPYLLALSIDLETQYNKQVNFLNNFK